MQMWLMLISRNYLTRQVNSVVKELVKKNWQTFEVKPNKRQWHHCRAWVDDCLLLVGPFHQSLTHRFETWLNIAYCVTFVAVARRCRSWRALKKLRRGRGRRGGEGTPALQARHSFVSSKKFILSLHSLYKNVSTRANLIFI